MIRQLSPTIIKKIAAGQVVERPASVVKELIENSVDAGTTFIKILIEEGGKAKITISDNGQGIPSDQLELACQSHTTSKIFSIADLDEISTFGFRGEALASIGLVSDMFVQSRLSTESVGAEIHILRGEIESMQPMGMAVGTTVIVKQLLHNLPGRRRSLKSASFEFKVILDVIVATALAHPQIGFFVQHNHKVILELAEQHAFDDRLLLLMGSTYLEQSLSFIGGNKEVSWSGIIGKPQLAQRNKQQQFLFVNNRPVRDRLVAQAIRNAFGSLLEPRMYPFFILHLNLNFNEVDVNIHPRKETVLFRESSIPRIIGEAAKVTIQEHNLLFQNTLEQAEANLMVRDVGMNTKLASKLKQKVRVWQPKEIEIEADTVLQIADTYLAVPTTKGLFMIDQHAAHERILYEQFLQQYQQLAETQKSQKLEPEVTFYLPITQTNFLAEQESTLEKIGFIFSINEKNMVTLSEVPELFVTMDIKSILLDVLHEIEEAFELGGSVAALPRAAEKTLSYLACRSAIKAGDVLNQEERQRLITKLLNTRTQYTCPHGRPTQVELTISELEKLFHRH